MLLDLLCQRFLTNQFGITIGNSLLIKRFLKGLFELKPPLPRYSFVWDVNIVLNFLSNYYPHDEQPFSIITYKLVMLLALSSYSSKSPNIKSIVHNRC